MKRHKRWRNSAVNVLGAVAVALLPACSDDPPGPPSICAAADQLCGVCAGVPAGDVCGDDTCTQGVTCAEVVAVANDVELSSKIAGATAGTCLALAPGHYGVVSLPGGVSLLGRSASAVTVEGISVAAGSGAVLRGLGVGPWGVELMGAMGVRIESVRVTGSPMPVRDGIALNPGSSATIVTSTISGASRIGVYAVDADVTLDRSIVSGAQVAGIFIDGTTCDAACACANSPTLSMSSSAIRDNHVHGLSLRGAAANLFCADVTGTKAGDAFLTGQRGGGVTAAQCSNLNASRLRVLDSADWGVFIHGSTAKLGSEASPDETVEISRNTRGLWVQDVVENAACPSAGGCVQVHNGMLAENRGVGIGITGESKGMIICKVSVLGTAATTLPVTDENGMVGGSQIVGDGVDWLDGSEVVIEALTLSGNERRSLLIDGPANGEIKSVTLAGGETPLLQQNLIGGAQPAQGNGVTLMTEETRKFAIPQPLSVASPL